MVFNLKKMFGKPQEEEYVEIDVSHQPEVKNKVMVRPFALKQFDDVNEILNSLREGYTIAVIDIKPLKSKDVIELKRAVAKVKKTVEAMEGKIAGFGENLIIATPQFADVYRAPPVQQKKDPLEMY